ncbi:MAG TPA: hypothetical protein VL262_15160 [Vicinamibacterales bacterium]|jgi:hypothetical protein|nr:hypothetical protein [Vicinamibacterales bacterium]
MKLGVRESALSVAVFVVVVFGLTMFDPRVRDTLSDLFTSGSVSPFGERMTDVGSALWTSARYQTLDNSPVVVFATVGTVLAVLMMRS